MQDNAGYETPSISDARLVKATAWMAPMVLVQHVATQTGSHQNGQAAMAKKM